MAGIQTNWILNLVDKITDPIKNVLKATGEVDSKLKDTEESVKFTGDALKEAFGNSQKYVKDVSKELKSAEKELRKLKNVSENSKSGTQRAKAIKDYERQKTKVAKLRKQLQGAESDLKNITQQTRKAKKATESWESVVLKVNQSLEIYEKVSSALNFTTEIQNLTTQTQRMTELSGASLDKYVAKSREIGNVYDEDSEKVARVANVLTKQLGGSYEENFKLIEEGFKRGANINGDFLDQLLEYPTQMRATGIAAKDMVAIIASANKQGGFSDKAMDSIKEGGLAIREMGKAQIDALDGIGVKTEALKGKTSWEALQIVMQAMQKENLTTQAKQLVLADIFKGAGEDAGQALIESLAEQMPQLENMPEVEQSGAGIKRFFSRISTQIGQSLGVVGTYSQQLTPAFQLIGGGVSLMKSLNLATKLQTASQWLLNVAMNANPIGLIVIGVTALIGYIAIAINYYDQFGASMLMLLGPIGVLINAFKSIYDHWDSIVQAFESDGILGAIKRIGIVLMDAVMKPMQQILETIARFDPTGLAQKGADALKNFRAENNLNTAGETSGGGVKKDDGGFSLAKHLNGEIPILSFGGGTNGEKTKNGGRVSGNTGPGLNLAGGNGGNKSIVMNLEIKNYFNSKSASVRDMADEIVGHINDRLKDNLVTLQ